MYLTTRQGYGTTKAGVKRQVLARHPGKPGGAPNAVLDFAAVQAC